MPTKHRNIVENLRNDGGYDKSAQHQINQAIEDVFFNRIKGKKTFKAIVLSGGPKAENVLATNPYYPIKVRPEFLAEQILPDPCASDFQGTEADARFYISCHPTAIAFDPLAAGDRPPGFGEEIDIEFVVSGPDNEGKQRGMRYRFPKQTTKYDYKCANKILESMKSNFSSFQPLGPISPTTPPVSPSSQPTYTPPDTTEKKSGGRQPVCPDNVEDYKRLKNLADTVGIDLPVLLAIRKVESSGRNSAIRFEPHRFLGRYRKDLKGTGKIPYKRSAKSAVDYTKKNTDKNAFLHAFSVDPVAAVKSTSWGAYQVMGSNAKRATDPIIKNAIASPEGAKAFVDYFYKNPVQASDLMLVAWFKSAGDYPRRMAQAKNWLKFATRYNGSRCCGPGTRNYHLKLQKYYLLSKKCPKLA